MDLHRNWQKDFKDADQRIQEEYGIKQVLDDACQGSIAPVFVMDAKNWRSLPGPSASMYSEYVSVAGSAAISVMILDAYSKQN